MWVLSLVVIITILLTAVVACTLLINWKPWLQLNKDSSEAEDEKKGRYVIPALHGVITALSWPIVKFQTNPVTLPSIRSALQLFSFRVTSQKKTKKQQEQLSSTMLVGELSRNSLTIPLLHCSLMFCTRGQRCWQDSGFSGVASKSIFKVIIGKTKAQSINQDILGLYILSTEAPRLLLMSNGNLQPTI